MPQLDRLLSVLVSTRGDAVELADGTPASVLAAGARRPLTRQALTGAQVVALVREVASAADAARLDAEQPVEFGYRCAEGSFRVCAGRDGERWRATVALALEAGASPSAPASPSQPALASTGFAAAATPADAAPIAAPTSAAVAAIAGFEPTALAAFDAPAHAAVVDASHAAPAPGTASAAAAPPPSLPTAPPAAARTLVVGDARAQREIDRLLRELVARKGSDLHLRVGEPPVVRASGELERLPDPPLTPDALEAMLVAIMPERNRGEYAERNDTDYAYEIEGCARFRANALRDRRGPAGVFRVIPATVVSVEEMGLSAEVQQLCYLTKGLVLVTGPTGSGKSTTLCAMVDLVNRSRAEHILTIEDPIEFVHPNKKCLVTQRQVGVHTDSFKSALRAALREDPDVILVGELRDLETIAIAIETAETGHLVFGTLHTTTAPGTVDRIIDQFPADRQAQIRVMLSESLKGVISQTLCRKIGGGRVAAREILLTNPAISNLIREGKTFQIPSILQTSKKLGMITLNDALLDVVDRGLVEPREAWTKAVEKAGFVAALRARGLDTSFADAAK